MFGRFDMHPGGGANPPYSPAYPLEWETGIHTVEVVTRVDRSKLEELLADTGFELVNDRLAFRFMLSPGHTLSLHRGRMFDLMVTAAVRYRDLYTQTHVYMYCSDPMGITAGRELFGYTKKDCDFEFFEHDDGHVAGSVTRRSRPLAAFSFTADASAPLVRLTDGDEQPGGELHVRRLPDPSGVGVAYADVVYRRTPIRNSEPLRGHVDLQLESSTFDPLTDLRPEVLSAQSMKTPVYGGGFEVEDRRLVERRIP